MNYSLLVGPSLHPDYALCGQALASEVQRRSVGLDMLGDASVELGHTVDDGTLGGDVIVTLGAREVEDEPWCLELEFLLDGVEGAEKGR